eukprot:1150574_1
MQRNLTPEELQDIYKWIDEVPLSRVKRNISRDFSDAEKVFKRLRFQLVEGDINDIVGCSAGAVERVLWFVRQKMSEFQQFKTRQASKKGTGEDKPNGRPNDKKEGA